MGLFTPYGANGLSVTTVEANPFGRSPTSVASVPELSIVIFAPSNAS